MGVITRFCQAIRGAFESLLNSIHCATTAPYHIQGRPEPYDQIFEPSTPDDKTSDDDDDDTLPTKILDELLGNK